MSEHPEGQNWRQLAVVQVGASICLPVLMVGHNLAQNHGLIPTVISVGLGNAVLFAMACMMAFLGASQKKSTAELAVDFFGKLGRQFFALAMCISMGGWFALQLKLMSLCLPVPCSHLLLGVLAGIAGLKGAKGVTLLASVFTPLLAATIGIAALLPGNRVVSAMEFSRLELSGLALVASTSIAAVIDLPTFFREARSPKEAMAAVFVLFCIALPAIEAAGAYLAVKHQGQDITSVLMNVSDSSLWKHWMPVFILLAGWAANNANLYSASVSLKQLMPGSSHASRVLLVSAAGTAASCFPLLENFEVFIGLIGLSLSGMGGIMLAQALFKRMRDGLYRLNILLWGAGTIFAFLAICGVLEITGFPMLDAFLTCFFARVAAGLFFACPKKVMAERAARSSRPGF